MFVKSILRTILQKKNLIRTILLFTLILTISTISKGDDSLLLKKPIGKIPPNGNPLISHKFGADPAVLVYKDRVYIYLTNDVLEYDKNGNVLENSYSKINKITVISSEDLVNWTDHGEIEVAGPNGIAKWAQNSWAPAVVHRSINGKDKFFLYFSNNANGIGVLTADTPLGPWTDPLRKSLINWATPGVAGVVWLFDPAVLIDDDRKAYIYFGGGVIPGKEENPNTARVMELGSDMISVIGTAVPIPAPYMFEASGINKINNIYYYSYCTNFGPRKPGGLPLGAIAYMVSKNPMNSWEYKGIILRNPGNFFGVGGNNHHQLFEFRGKWYIAYHAQTLAKSLGIAKGYRSPHINELQIENGSIKEVFADYKGVSQVKNFDPYRIVEAETYAWCAGISTKRTNASNNMCLTDIGNGDWIALSKVDFGNNPPQRFEVVISNIKSKGYIEIRVDSLDGKKIGILKINPQDNKSSWIKVETPIERITGVHDLYLVFRGENENLFDFDYWQFIR